MRSLPARVARLEAARPMRGLDSLPVEVQEQGLDLYVRMFAHALLGLSLDDLRAELRALDPPLVADSDADRRPLAEEDKEAVRDLTLDLLRSEPENAEYARLLAMLQRVGTGPDSGPVCPTDAGAASVAGVDG